MESGLNKAFCGVYNSSREIIRNNQRHLFCNMLDLLSRTTKTTGEKYLNMDEFILFWTTDILPLIFDDDKEIQKSAIAAMETVASIFNFKTIHNSARWSDIKTKIVQTYSKEIYKYREASNSYWHRIWCILIRILDKEIIKGASTINTFLSIVELGFRSPDYNVRAEAFYCWKVLIEIFANNNEICSPKRIRLICIPLKSSHSKTTQAAAVKFKVWWYLITKINVHIEQYVDAILEPFLSFCYGSVNRNSPCVADFKEMTILCLISLLGTSTKLIKKRMEYFDIESLPEPLINKNIMRKSWNSIITYSTEAINDCSSINSIGDEFSKLLLQCLMTHVFSIENNDALYLFFDKLGTCNDKDVTLYMQKFICNYNFASCIAAVESDDFLGKSLSTLCKFISSGDAQSSTAALEEIVKSIFALNANRFRHVLNVFLNAILSMSSRLTEASIAVWKLVTQSLIKNFGRSHQGECNASLNIINQWIIWPLKAYSEVQNHSANVFDDQFDVILHMSVERLCSAIDKANFLKETSLLLLKMYKLKAANSDLNAYFACFIRILVSSSHIEHDEKLLSTTFSILKLNLSGDFHKTNFELCMKCLKGLVTYLGESGVDNHFGDIKDAWSQVINYKRNNHIEKASFEDHRKQFLDDVKKVASKAQYNKMKNYLENDDLFVIIPAVWSLNPDKLTERQKEKFFEKSDIPALYNDMSQSQDALIKPWTPKKLVIARGHVEEIVIGDGKDANEILNSSFTSGNQNGSNDDSFSKTFVSPKPIMSLKRNIVEAVSQKNSETPISKMKYNGSIRAQEEEVPTTNCRITRTKISSQEGEDTPNNSNLDDYVEQVEAIILKDTSSPPDRKQTNNSTSPVLKPKTTHLTGRGAQLINMIRNKKHENYNAKPLDTSTPVTKMEPNRERVDTCLNWSNESESKLSPMNLLVFSKTLPSPCASPSASILKRKHLNDSIDDVYDSQSYKRKRVSFHDPPVSVTKEYLKDEENKNNSKRCLLLDQELKGTTRHILRRSAKIENQNQNEQYSEMSTLSGTALKKVNCNLMSCDENGLKNVDDSGSSLPKAPFPFLFRTEGDVLNYVVNQFSIEDICEKYLSGDKSDKAGSNLSKFISQYMNANSKFKSTILETLSEKHPEEFLDYAIQENLSSVVCDRLNSNSVIDYICSKSQTNVACRTRLFQEIQDILNHEKLADEKYEFIQKAVTSKSMSDQQLLNLIELLFESKRKHQRAVSESAIDSSSTL